jgi:hypothetical protein
MFLPETCIQYEKPLRSCGFKVYLTHYKILRDKEDIHIFMLDGNSWQFVKITNKSIYGGTHLLYLFFRKGKTMVCR